MTPEQEELTAMIAGCAAAHQDALKNLYDRTSAKLFGICLRVCGEREGAEEVLQDVYLKIWRKAAFYDPAKASPITWLATIARNAAIDWRRAQPVTTASLDANDSSAMTDADAPDIEADIDRRALRHHILDCVARLEARQAQAVRTAFFEGLTHSELSARMGVPLGTLKSWIRRAMIALRECIDHDD